MKRKFAFSNHVAFFNKIQIVYKDRTECPWEDSNGVPRNYGRIRTVYLGFVSEITNPTLHPTVLRIPQLNQIYSGRANIPEVVMFKARRVMMVIRFVDIDQFVLLLFHLFFYFQCNASYQGFR